MNSRQVTMSLGIAAILAATGCGVPQSKHDTTVAKLKGAERNLTQATDAHNKTKQALVAAEMRIKGMRAHLQSVQGGATLMSAKVASLEARLQACKVPPTAPTTPGTPPPPPDAGSASAAGGLDLAAVQDGIMKLMPKVKRCYQTQILKKGKTLAGTLLVKFRIDKRGKARGVNVRKGTMKHRRLQKCVRRVFQRARFARSKKTTKVSYPLRFAP